MLSTLNLYFLICRSKDQNLSEKLGKFGGKSEDFFFFEKPCWVNFFPLCTQPIQRLARRVLYGHIEAVACCAQYGFIQAS